MGNSDPEILGANELISVTYFPPVYKSFLALVQSLKNTRVMDTLV
jgi:hypothetical protein